MENIKSNLYSHFTAKKREFLSFPAKVVHSRHLLVGEILDYGCGFGSDVEILKAKGLEIVGYDKHYFPDYPGKKFDTIICFYVLNVLLQEEQTTVLMEISQLLKPTGIAYFAVRRDIQYEGFRMHKLHRKPTYQCNVALNFPSIFKNENCEIYEYQHFTRTIKKANTDCPFCNPDSERELIAETATTYAIFDKYPVNSGHALIIPKKHTASYFDLTVKEQTACVIMLNQVKKIVQQRFNTLSFNVGINIGSEAGQTVPHVHIHLIPRYPGDVADPQGGVRGVVPERKNYL